MELAALLVAVDRAELGDAQRQVLVAHGLVLVDHAVVRAVHGLQQVLLALLGGGDGAEGVGAVVVPVAAGNVELLAADVRGDDLLVAVALLDTAQVLLQAQAQVGALGQPPCR